MTRPADPRRTLARRSTFSRALTGLARCLKWLLVSLLISILIEWVGMVFWWEEQGLAHSRQMLVNELQYLGTDLDHGGWAAQEGFHVQDQRGFEAERAGSELAYRLHGDPRTAGHCLTDRPGSYLGQGGSAVYRREHANEMPLSDI